MTPFKLFIPTPLQIVIDDVGWWSGTDARNENGPSRSAMGRRHVPADYEAIVSLGRALNMRPQAALALCEWDRENRLRDVPTATWMGENWECPAFPEDDAEVIVDLFNREAAHIEPVVHALGHEYWDRGQCSRAEWCDRQGKMRDPADVHRHLDAFFSIYAARGFRAPLESFVPAAFLHRFGDDGQGLASILSPYGIRFISTPFRSMFLSRPTRFPHVGIEDGVLTVDRGKDPFHWGHVAPSAGDAHIEGPICGLHWPNLLHHDPSRNNEAVLPWIDRLRQWAHHLDRMLAPDTRSFMSQLLTRNTLALRKTGSGVTLDFRQRDAMPVSNLGDEFFLRVPASPRLRIRATGLTVLRRSFLPEIECMELQVRRADERPPEAYLEWTDSKP